MLNNFEACTLDTVLSQPELAKQYAETAVRTLIERNKNLANIAGLVGDNFLYVDDAVAVMDAERKLELIENDNHDTIQTFAEIEWFNHLAKVGDRASLEAMLNDGVSRHHWLAKQALRSLS